METNKKEKETIDQLKKQLPMISTLSYMPYYIIDRARDIFCRISDNSDYLLGMPMEEILLMGPTDYYETYFPRLVKQAIESAKVKALRIYPTLTDEERKTFQIRLNVALQLPSGIRHVQHRIHPIAIEDRIDQSANYLLGAIAMSSSKQRDIAIMLYMYQGKLKRFRYNGKADKWELLEQLELSEIEKRILTLFYRGLDYKSVAREVGHKPLTVQSYKKKLFDKLGVHTIGEAISFAISYKLL